MLIGIVGPAGAGKSTLSQLLCAACTILSGTPWVQCVSMDGYSFPNSRLVAEQAVDNLGRICTLKDIKGLPSTLDVNVLLQDLLRLGSAGNDPIFLPAYDRGLHEPVPNSVAIATDCKIVIFEGEQLTKRFSTITRTRYDVLIVSPRFSPRFSLKIRYNKGLGNISVEYNKGISTIQQWYVSHHKLTQAGWLRTLLEAVNRKVSRSRCAEVLLYCFYFR